MYCYGKSRGASMQLTFLGRYARAESFCVRMMVISLGGAERANIFSSEWARRPLTEGEDASPFCRGFS